MFFFFLDNIIFQRFVIQMGDFIDTSSLDGLRAIHESDEQWNLRQIFIKRHMTDYPKNRLLCLAQVYCNMHLLGCTYNENLMATVEKMGEGICEEVFKDRKRSFEHSFAKASTVKKAKLESRNGSDISKDSPCALKRKSFMLMKAQLTVLEKEAEPLTLLNKLTSRLKCKWELKDIDNGKSALLINDVKVLEGLFPAWNNNDAKNFAAAAALAVISRDSGEVRAKNGKFELWQANNSPADCYTSYIVDSLKTAVKVLPSNGTSFYRLEAGLCTVRMPMRYIAEHGTGWEQKISINALNVQLASAVLRKGECTKSREKERREDLASTVIQKLSGSNLVLLESSSGYILKQ